jgi:anti-sigma regulatory factor (Ser/Thr protein kinase)
VLSRHQLQITNSLAGLATLQGVLQQYFTKNSISDDAANDLMLVTEELVVNIINYGYKDQQERSIDIVFEIEGKLAKRKLSIIVIDDAMPFNPLSHDMPELGLPSADVEIGGLGIPLIRRLSDGQHYEYKEGRNIFSVSKTIAGN